MDLCPRRALGVQRRPARPSPRRCARSRRATRERSAPLLHHRLTRCHVALRSASCARRSRSPTTRRTSSMTTSVTTVKGTALLRGRPSDRHVKPKERAAAHPEQETTRRGPHRQRIQRAEVGNARRDDLRSPQNASCTANAHDTTTPTPNGQRRRTATAPVASNETSAATSGCSRPRAVAEPHLQLRHHGQHQREHPVDRTRVEPQANTGTKAGTHKQNRRPQTAACHRPLGRSRAAPRSATRPMPKSASPPTTPNLPPLTVEATCNRKRRLT